MRRTFLLTAFMAAAVASHATVTIATFSDPSNGNPFLFDWDMANNTLTGSWSGSGLNLLTPGFTGGGQVNNATFSTSTISLTTVIAGVLYNMGSGGIVFSDSNSNMVFDIKFQGGTFLNPLNAGASSAQGNSVSFSGPNVPSNLANESFSFSLANPTVSGSHMFFTASFTSSADVVPEPASLLALGAGVLAVVRRRKA